MNAWEALLRPTYPKNISLSLAFLLLSLRLLLAELPAQRPHLEVLLFIPEYRLPGAHCGHQTVHVLLRAELVSDPGLWREAGLQQQVLDQSRPEICRGAKGR